MVQKFGIIGSGSWATALAKILTDNKHLINWWIRNKNSIDHICQKHNNPDYLSSVNFDVSLLSMYDDVTEVVRRSDILVIAVPSAFVESSLKESAATDWKGKKVVSAIKGLLPETNILLNFYLHKQ